ncbi:TIGR04283 family arsenosugar biosynthesis glycosyltransferase [Zhongshania marina]|uniref:TIGR04283 family arsenosugar biosynthesis glycosyltransferase n=1 Tax=Zhongshania marina TaxID=2304603 RepID=UPI0026CBE0A0
MNIVRDASSIPALSVVIPVLNEAQVLPELLAVLHQQISNSDYPLEVIFVDGGSTDNSRQLICEQGFDCLQSERGRARQLNVGAAAARADNLLFLHADSSVADGGFEAVLVALENHLWGRFDLRISGNSVMFLVIAFCMNWRSRLTGIATGDQGIFVKRAMFEQLGGFPNQALMEDIALSARLRKLSPPVCLALKISTSGRRWEKGGVWKTIFLMWRLRFMYWLGVSPNKLVKRYD